MLECGHEAGIIPEKFGIDFIFKIVEIIGDRTLATCQVIVQRISEGITIILLGRIILFFTSPMGYTDNNQE